MTTKNGCFTNRLISVSKRRRDEPFKLDESFFAQYIDAKPKFGYNGLGEFVYYRTYSRSKPDGTKETFPDTIRRVVEGCYEIQRRYCHDIHVPWTANKAQRSAQEMFKRIWDFKFLPPGRGLWCMGTPFMWEHGSAALQNCGFYSTEHIDKDPAAPFTFMIDMSMLGVGVGFDTRGAGKLRLHKPTDHVTNYVIEDSREGWVDSINILIESYTINPAHGRINYDYSKIRKAGSDIKGFGGKASGPGTLQRLHISMRAKLDEIAARPNPFITSVDIVDLMNFIGVCVVAGNVRRSSQLSLGDFNDADYTSMKDKNLYRTELCSHRWASNNSVCAQVGMDYSKIAKQVACNGEPGFLWLDNMRNFGRMIDGRQEDIDSRVFGANPCVEMSLESGELCNLCEVFPAKHDSVEDYYRTLKFAYLYAKTVTLLPTHNSTTNSVLLRNRRIGLSHSGIIQAFAKFGRRTVLEQFCDRGYQIVKKWDNIYSDWLCCPRSIKITAIKPSGSVSLVAGATAGIHYTIAPSRTYWRRVRVSNDSTLLSILRDAGYEIEPAASDPNTSVVKFGISEPSIPTVGEISIWQQVKNAVDYQRYWADNQVSCTVQFNSDEADQIGSVLEAFDDDLKGLSFLPIETHGYAQPPYEAASEAAVIEYCAKLKPLDLQRYIIEDAVATKFCESDTCSLQ